MHIIRIGIDLAKNTFSICSIDAIDKIVVEPTLKRKELLDFFTNTTACMVAMEAESGAHSAIRDREQYSLINNFVSDTISSIS